MPRLDYGQIVQAPYVLPHPTKKREYVSELRAAKVSGFSQPNQRGDILVTYEDGSKAWVDPLFVNPPA